MSTHQSEKIIPIVTEEEIHDALEMAHILSSESYKKSSELIHHSKERLGDLFSGDREARSKEYFSTLFGEYKKYEKLHYIVVRPFSIHKKLYDALGHEKYFKFSTLMSEIIDPKKELSYKVNVRKIIGGSNTSIKLETKEIGIQLNDFVSEAEMYESVITKVFNDNKELFQYFLQEYRKIVELVKGAPVDNFFVPAI